MYELNAVDFDASKDERVSLKYETIDFRCIKKEKNVYDEPADMENKIEVESKIDTYKNFLRMSADTTCLKKVVCFLLLIITSLVIALVVLTCFFLSTTKETDTKRCGELTDVSNVTIVNITGYKHGDTITFRCMNGSKLNGPSIITCLSSDKWSAAPACVRKQCDNYVAPAHAIVLLKTVSREVGTEIQITCEDGHLLKGNKHVICQSNEIWSESPLCEPINCGNPAHVTNGQFTGYSNTFYNRTFSVLCNEGYELKGSVRITCQISGQWSDTPSCGPVFCGVPQIPKNGSLKQLSGTTFQATASIKCDDGFEVKGNSLTTCTADGTWTESPKCVIIDARDCLEIRRKFNITESGLYHITLWQSGHTIEVYCDQVTDDGGWTVFQYRYDGSVDFYRTFDDYENGFGNLTGEFWLGLKYVEEMTSRNWSELRIDLSAADGSTTYETFKNFSLTKQRSYELHFNKKRFDTAIKRDLTYNNGHQFTTFDHDVDEYEGNCAVYNKGSWWYDSCTYANLNGEYITPGTVHAEGWHRGMIYYTFIYVHLRQISLVVQINIWCI